MHDRMTKLSMHTDATRSDIAPQLNCIKEIGEDQWEWCDNDTVVRAHMRRRRELFTPSRIEGAPLKGSLTAVRITQGKFDDGKEFVRRDHWTNKDVAHLVMQQPWTGTTTFILKSANLERP